MSLTPSKSWISRQFDSIFPPHETRPLSFPSTRRRRPRFVRIQVKLQQWEHYLRYRIRRVFAWFFLLSTCAILLWMLLSLLWIGVDRLQLGVALDIFNLSSNQVTSIWDGTGVQQMRGSRLRFSSDARWIAVEDSLVAAVDPSPPPPALEELSEFIIGTSSIPDLSLTVILPISPNTMSSLAELLTPLTADTPPSSLKEIIITCPEFIVTPLRRDLQRFMSNIISSGTPSAQRQPDISLHPLRSGSPKFSTTTTSSLSLPSISTDWTLVLDENGLQDTEEDLRRFLLNPKALPVPVGPIGAGAAGYATDTTVVPAHTSDTNPASFSLASFLDPPFVVPTALLNKLSQDQLEATISLRSPSQISAFAALGAIAASQHNMTSPLYGIRGLIVGFEGDLELESPLDSHSPSDSRSSLESIEAPVDVNSPTLPLTQGRSLPAGNSGLALLFLSLHDLHSFSQAACHLQRNLNRTLDIGILIGEDAQTGSMSLDDMACRLELAFLSASGISLPWDQGAAAMRWIQELPVNVDILITSLAQGIGQLLSSDMTVINIPRQDLRYSDWIGTLSVLELKNWHIPVVDISIVTQDRPQSLNRLFTSLSSGRFFGDTVNVRINMDQSTDAYTMKLVHGFQWDYGVRTLNRRVVQGGLLPAVVESWYPLSNDTYGLILEDDIEVSPLFYAWIKMAILQYRYGSQSKLASQMFGISLFQQKQNELHITGRQTFNARAIFDAQGTHDPSTPFLSQIPCSWGAVYFPEHWREFHDYLAMRLSEARMDIKSLIVPDVRSNYWTKSWKKYFIELANLRGYVMLYPNYPDFMSFSTNHLEVGAHIKVDSKLSKELFLLPLMQLPEGEEETRTGLLDLPNQTLPELEDLPVFNLTGVMTSVVDLEGVGRTRRREALGCGKIEGEGSSFDVRELFCVEGIGK